MGLLSYSKKLVYVVIILYIVSFIGNIYELFNLNITKYIEEINNAVTTYDWLLEFMGVDITTFSTEIITNIRVLNISVVLVVVCSLAIGLAISLLISYFMRKLLNKLESEQYISLIRLACVAFMSYVLLQLGNFSLLDDFLDLINFSNFIIVVTGILINITLLTIIILVSCKFIVAIKNHEYKSNLFMKEVVTLLLIISGVAIATLLIRDIALMITANIIITKLSLTENSHILDYVMQFLTLQFNQLTELNLELPDYINSYITQIERGIDTSISIYLKEIINNFFTTKITNQVVYIVLLITNYRLLNKVEKNLERNNTTIAYVVITIITALILILIDPFGFARLIGVLILIIAGIQIYSNKTLLRGE